MSLTPPEKHSKIYTFMILNISCYADIHNEAATNVIMPLET